MNVQFSVNKGRGTGYADGCDIKIFYYWHHMEWRLLFTVIGHQQKTLGSIITVCLGFQDSQQEVLNSLKMLFNGQTFSIMVCFCSGKGLCPIFLQGVPNFHKQLVPESVNESQNVQKSSGRITCWPISHSDQCCWLSFKIQTVQINFPKLFLASNYSYLTYLCWLLGDTKYCFGLSCMAVDTGKMQGACVRGQAEETHHCCKSK